MMHKRGFMLAIGIPLAREDQGEHDDEYKLGPREHDSSDEQQRPHDALTSIYEGIRDGGGDEQMMRDAALTLARCLTRMAKAQDHDELADFYERCCRLVDALDDSEGDDGKDDRGDDRDE